MSLRAVFFDLDGTLLDTAPNLAKALNLLLQRNGRSAMPESRIRSVVSEGAYALLQLGFGINRDHPNTPEMRQALLDYYAQDLSSATQPFAGVSELIATLAGRDIMWGVVTNKPEPYALPLMAEYHFASDPVCLICPENVTQRKPHPESLYLACELAQCGPEEAIYVGDHRRDIECGQNASMTTIAASYGYIPPGENVADWQADHIVTHGQELWPTLKGYL